MTHMATMLHALFFGGKFISIFTYQLHVLQDVLDHSKSLVSPFYLQVR